MHPELVSKGLDSGSISEHRDDLIDLDGGQQSNLLCRGRGTFHFAEGRVVSRSLSLGFIDATA